SDGRAPGGGLVVPGSAAGGDAGGADVVTPALSDEPIWPPRPEELLELLAEVDFSVTAVAERLGRARETVGRLVQKMFGPGGKGAAKRAVRVWRASGRVPGAEEIDAAYVLYFETSGPGVAEARARWERDGELG
ncbi:MAG: hypothetical protein KC635_15195, partial [Myxococcales bacterium]|nr:hypothetical protein [Myxococcales bacterium]